MTKIFKDCSIFRKIMIKYVNIFAMTGSLIALYINIFAACFSKNKNVKACVIYVISVKCPHNFSLHLMKFVFSRYKYDKNTCSKTIKIYSRYVKKILPSLYYSFFTFFINHFFFVMINMKLGLIFVIFNLFNKFRFCS